MIGPSRGSGDAAGGRGALPVGRRALTVLAVVAVLALAGCGGGGTATTGTTDGTTATTATTPPSEAAYTDTGERLLERGLASEAPADSFTVSQNITYLRDANRTTVIESTRRVDRGADRAVVELDQQVFGDTTSVRYTTGNVTYGRTVRGSVGEPTYTVARAPYGDDRIGPVTMELVAGELDTFLEAFGWEQRGVVVRNGTPLTRYRSTEVRNRSVLTGGVQGQVSNASVTIFVSPEGVMREQNIRYDLTRDGQTITVVQTVTVTDIGSTTVAEPDWLEEARKATDGG